MKPLSRFTAFFTAPFGSGKCLHAKAPILEQRQSDLALLVSSFSDHCYYLKQKTQYSSVRPELEVHCASELAR